MDVTQHTHGLARDVLGDSRGLDYVMLDTDNERVLFLIVEIARLQSQLKEANEILGLADVYQQSPGLSTEEALENGAPY